MPLVERNSLILIEVAFGLSFCILLFRAFISTIPRELDEAAIIDGCSRFQIIWRIIFPIMLPGIVATALVLAFGLGFVRAPLVAFPVVLSVSHNAPHAYQSVRSNYRLDAEKAIRVMIAKLEGRRVGPGPRRRRYD